MSSSLRACPRRGCYLVVNRLIQVIVIEGLTQHDPEWICASCLREVQDVAAGDSAVIIELTGRELT